MDFDLTPRSHQEDDNLVNLQLSHQLRGATEDRDEQGAPALRRRRLLPPYEDAGTGREESPRSHQ